MPHWPAAPHTGPNGEGCLAPVLCRFYSPSTTGLVGRLIVVPPAEQLLRALVDAIVAHDDASFGSLIDGSPALATASFPRGATRQAPGPNLVFIQELGYVIYSGDTALHIAAAAYRYHMADRLISAGANVRARNRRGCEPLHAAAFGSPGSTRWDPAAQVATIECLIGAGADPNGANMDGATPLHRAVRTRCAAAVHALLAHGANPAVRNKSGSTAADLALHNTGRSGSGSTEAKAQLEEILQLLQSH